MVKLTIKTAVTLAAAESACGGPLFKTGIFGTVYVIMTFHVWYMDKQWGFFDFIKQCCLCIYVFISTCPIERHRIDPKHN